MIQTSFLQPSSSSGASGSRARELQQWLEESRDHFEQLRPLYQTRLRMTAALRSVSARSQPPSPEDHFVQRMIQLERQRLRASELFCDLTRPEPAWKIEQRKPQASKKTLKFFLRRAATRIVSWLKDPLITVDLPSLREGKP